MQQVCKRLAMLLLTMLLVSSFAGMVSALETGDKVRFTHVLAYRGGRQSGEGTASAPGNRRNHYNNRPYWYNGFAIDILTLSGSGLKAQYNGQTYAYCIQYQQSYGDPNRVVEGTGDELLDSKFWDSLGVSKQRLLSRLMPHTFPAKTPQELGVSTVDDAYAASQVVIWEIVEGYRDAIGNLTNSTLRDQYLKYTYTGSGHTAGQDTPAMTAYNSISHALITHSITPSWSNQTVTLEWNDAKQRYEASIADRNGVLEQFTLDSNNQISTSVSGNTLTVSSKEALSGTVTLTMHKNLKRAADTGALAILGSGSSQKMMYGLVDDPVNANIRIATNTSRMRLVKTTTIPGGTVSGIWFKLSKPYSEDRYAQTNSSGVIDLNLPAGQYTITELGLSKDGSNYPSTWEVQPPQTVTLTAAHTASNPLVVSFANKPKTQSFKIYKESEDGVVANLPFLIQPTSGSLGLSYGLLEDQTGLDIQRWWDGYTEIYRNNELIGYQYDSTKTTMNGRVDTGNGVLLYTDGSGCIAANLPVGSYDVTEVLYLIDGYERYDEAYTYGTVLTPVSNPTVTQRVTVSSSNTSVSFYNYLVAGQALTISKQSEDGELRQSFKIEALDAGNNVLWEETIQLPAGGTDTFDILPAGTYRISELYDREIYKTPSWTVNGVSKGTGDSVTVTLAPRTTANAVAVRAVNTCNRTYLKIAKTSESGQVSGIRFRIKKVSGSSYGTFTYKTTETGATQTASAGGILVTTNSAGSCDLWLLEGTYEITEETVIGDMIPPQPQRVTLTKGQNEQSVSFTNLYQRGSLQILKTFETAGGGTTVKEGVRFRVSCAAVGYDEIHETDAAGEILLTNLRIGSYTITELDNDAVMKGYELAPSMTVTVAYNETAAAAITNRLQTGSLRVVKTFEGKDSPVAGVPFRITGQYVAGGTYGATHYTDKNGEILLDNLPIGDYFVTELESDISEGYLLSGTKTVVVAADQATVVDIQNKLIRGSLNVYKLDGDSCLPLEGAGFRLFDKDGKVIDEQYTSSDGNLFFSNIPYGDYTYQEFHAPTGYQLDDTVYSFSIRQQWECITVTRENRRLEGGITIRKTDSAGQALAGAAYLLEYSIDGGSSWQPVISRTGDIVTAGGCTSTGLIDGQLTTDTDGNAAFMGLLADNKTLYRLTETRAPEGHTLLPSPVFEGTLPAAYPEDAVDVSNIEDYEQRDGMIYLYRLSFTVSDGISFAMPFTGGTGFPLLPLGAALCSILPAAGLFAGRKREVMEK